MKLVILGHFLPFSPFPLKNPKTKILKNEKNLLEISSFCTCVPKITIIWCMVPEIQSETDRFFCHSEAIFCPFTNPPSPNDPEIQNLKKKWKKCLEILFFYTYMCTINEDHMIYGSWNIRCDRKNYS